MPALLVGGRRIGEWHVVEATLVGSIHQPHTCSRADGVLSPQEIAQLYDGTITLTPRRTDT